ncbi:hypothetical protein [Brachyspira hyodysenteriae]|uniref:Uncharacterized protein n=2 Tax=Brachyspira hyodysenteriae TaxID=159 RepID=A0A3B6V9L0_BRAHW|nr:hypothetical protein [Brachyspira hyodysenteriae]ACN84442.1 hypothetical protein BHWA1_01982 [Brachyspira hyodysenteriae WA1]ANN63474.1 hypothetical protein BHYOB78_06225 [Brachyspira hyodysenteriae ATCC 27164]KLI21051.1 hypothetical protein SR30_12865 [Brachyspira hyodysenteriae]KLI24533.1 hypothetical protein SZ47_09825 [Brachyspira hyodysenteriae]KLI28585.1 hypothetical protein SZ49_13635 [Brachyspira hyodysenteriae]
MTDINTIEKEFIIPIIKKLKEDFFENNSEEIDEDYIKKLIFNYKNADLDKDDIPILSFILMMLASFSSYEDDYFDKKKFHEFMEDIMSKFN